MDRRDARDADPLTGRLLDGRYRIGTRIARGGMASVYEATDLRLDRIVAVKVMHPGLAHDSGDDDSFAQRFVREARAAARLSHPNVVAVFDQGTDDDAVFLAMEYVPGHTLRDVIRAEAPMSPQRALAYLEPVLSALAAAHRAGLIHRDIKPENVLIAEDGRIKVADFGLAKAVSADTQHTATGGVLIGTVSYVAPELVVDGRADARADVYAAGVVLHELLTGRKPHEGESPIQVAYKHVHEDIPAPSLLVPGLPAYVDALVARATARDVTLRPADAQVLLHQVRRVKAALSAGVLDDPELTADLALPTAAATQVPTTTDELPELHEAAWTPSHEPDDGFDDSRDGGTYAGGATSMIPAYAPAGREDRRSRRGLFLLVGALVLALVVGFGAWWFGVARYTTTPGVIDLTAAKAEQKIEAAGLDYRVSGEAYDENVPAGSVISTDPGAGERILPGETVEVVLSKGKERYKVPELKGKTEDAAQAALAAAHLSFGRSIPRNHETLPKGRVITSTPDAGQWLKRDTAVDLIVSSGPRPIAVRDFTGEKISDAREWFGARKIEVTVRQEYNDEVAKGRIIEQDPDEGTLYRGDTVELLVSKGPELVTIPRLKAMGKEAAEKALEDLGLKARTRKSALYLGLGYVSKVEPGEGEQVPKGSTVVLYLV